MAMTSAEAQQAYRDRRYEAGYKPMQVWVLREPGKSKMMSKDVFLEELDKRTKGWNKAKRSMLFNECLKLLEVNFTERGERKTGIGKK
jgi:uncharacterized short protein YbdD (DUF466 family)